MDKNILLKTISVGALQTNCYIIADKREKQGFVVDPGADARHIQKIARKEQIDIKGIIITHGHYDHIGAVGAFEAPVYIHAADVPALSDSAKNLSAVLGMAASFSAAAAAVEEGRILSAGVVRLKVIHTPGHTPGSICLYSPGILFSGDTLFYRGVGRTDLPGGSARQINDSIREKLFVLPEETAVFPGHGAPTTIGEEKKENLFVYEPV